MDPELTSWKTAITDRNAFPSDEQLNSCGLVQLKNGPCGLLASVYASLIRFLVFEPVCESPLLRPQQALCDALSAIIWQSKKTDSSPAQLVLLSSSGSSEGKQAADDNKTSQGSLLGLLEGCGVGMTGKDDVGLPQYASLLNVVATSSFEELRALVARHLGQFQAPGGILLFLYSVVLTRTVEQVKADGLGATSLLCPGNGHCRHELVNLLIIGKATASIHDASNTVACSLLGPGLEQAGQIGFLSPPNEQAMLGNCMKWPKLPIWVVLGGAHYTVLFSPSRNAQGVFSLLNAESFSKPTTEVVPCYHFNGLSSLRWRRNAVEMAGPRFLRATLTYFDWQQENKTDLAKFASNLDAKDMPWNCSACTFKNSPASSACIMCMSARPALLTCPACKTQSSASSTTCSNCRAPLPKPAAAAAAPASNEAWNCGVCGSRQSGAAAACTICTAFRTPPTSANTPAPADLTFFQCVQQDDEVELRAAGKRDKARPDASHYLFLVQPASPSLAAPVADVWVCSKCNKTTSLATVMCQWCDSPHPCVATAWYCGVCASPNSNATRNCRMCTSERGVSLGENRLYHTEPKGNDQSEAPYLCRTCSARNSVLVAPVRCAVCNSPRFLPWLAYWLSFSQLSSASKKEAYKRLPELLFSLHILHPKVTLRFPNESTPSLTT